MIVAYPVAQRMDPGVLVTPEFSLLKQVMTDVEGNKGWSAKVALERQDPWFLPGSKMFGHHLLSLGF